VPHEPPPPGFIAHAEQEYHDARDRLAVIIDSARILLGGAGRAEAHAFADVYRTLLHAPDGAQAVKIGAAAIVQLAVRSDTGDGEGLR
jgi:hypothetical protein